MFHNEGMAGRGSGIYSPLLALRILAEMFQHALRAACPAAAEVTLDGAFSKRSVDVSGDDFGEQFTCCSGNSSHPPHHGQRRQRKKRWKARLERKGATEDPAVVLMITQGVGLSEGLMRMLSAQSLKDTDEKVIVIARAVGLIKKVDGAPDVEAVNARRQFFASLGQEKASWRCGIHMQGGSVCRPGGQIGWQS